MISTHRMVLDSIRKVFRYSIAVAFFVSFSYVSIARSDSIGPRPALFGLSPDNGHSFVTQILNSARQEVILNIYELENVDIVNTIKSAIARNVTFRILIEGSPVQNFGAPGVSPAGAAAIKAIVGAMKASKNSNHQFFIMKKTEANIKRRYTYDHAKYMVIDGRDTFVSSENFSDGGQPLPGKAGNRGWHVLIRDSRLVDQFTKLYLEDTDMKAGDIIDALQANLAVLNVSKQPANEMTLNGFSATTDTRRPMPILRGVVSATAVFTSPQSLAGLTNVIRSARKSLDVEFMSLPIEWYDRSKKAYYPSPLANEVVQAAKRGVRVRILLNDQRAFGMKPTERNMNLELVCAVNKMAENEKTPIAGKIVDLKKAGLKIIHNKGMIVDRARTLVSSINGTANSVQANRETAIFIDSIAAANYYGSAFDADWNASVPPTEEECKKATDRPKPQGLVNFHDVFAF